MNHGGVALVIAVGLLAASAPAEARSFRQSEVPNGSQLECDTCHIIPGGPLNAFGEDCESSQEIPGDGVSPIRWEIVYNLDSDGDGWPNGYELGDPAGDWRAFDPNPVYVSNPADPNSKPDGEPPDPIPDPEPEPEPAPEPEPEPAPEPAPEPEPDAGPLPDTDEPAPDVPMPTPDMGNGEQPADAGDADDGPGYVLGPACGVAPTGPARGHWIWVALIAVVILRR